MIPPEITDNIIEIISYAINALLGWIAYKLKRKNNKLNRETVLHAQTPQSRATRDAIKQIRSKSKM